RAEERHPHRSRRSGRPRTRRRRDRRGPWPPVRGEGTRPSSAAPARELFVCRAVRGVERLESRNGGAHSQVRVSVSQTKLSYVPKSEYAIESPSAEYWNRMSSGALSDFRVPHADPRLSERAAARYAPPPAVAATFPSMLHASRTYTKPGCGG